MSEKFNVIENFGCQVFNDAIMRERLPKHIYQSLKKTMNEGLSLEANVAEVVATVMKDWAIEKGATHYTHWFQPMTGITAEKHDSFITSGGDGKALMEFSGKELIKGEPDASSFPSGGLRATFEARGYTAWDPTSYAFVKDGTLYIPTAFCSYSGEVLDKKTPLLRSMEVINHQALRVLRLLGNTTATRVNTTVGAEQEYFLVDKELYNQRRDLQLTGRTLFGARAPKGQEMEDHYFGHIKPRVAAYMTDLDRELWKLGIYSKTKHNEAAPSQHEMAPIFETTNIATDHNQLTMEIMRSVADKHGFACLLHEKPYAGVNGSGKHDNWSISTNDGQNLLDPGKSPQKNAQFLLFLSAVLKAVDEYAPLLRVSVASPGNDHRLGANEAPPAIVSMFIGEELENILKAIEQDGTGEKITKSNLLTDINVLPDIYRDSTDRNRTSPFAFTGNKFEFRMLGSSLNIAGPNIMLNTIIAEELGQFADRLEKAEDIPQEVHAIIKETYRDHKRIVFNGNNYSEEWLAEAQRRGLPNLISTVDALPAFIEPKNIEVLVKNGVFSETEIRSRYEILMENYSKVINIEALTMIDMARKQILPAVIEYTRVVCDALAAKKCLDLDLNTSAETKLAKKLSSLSGPFSDAIDTLENDVVTAKGISGVLESGKYYHETVFADMQALRALSDELEILVGEDYWPIPTYADLLF
ncbi:MAG: glutamine synthetase III [Oscillospiraceae bacterium]|jgi:glutamine synthetase